MDSDWAYREDDWPNISDSGSAVVMVENTTVITKISLILLTFTGCSNARSHC